MKKFLFILGTIALLAMPSLSYSQVDKSIWYIYVNYNTKPATIGVAGVGYKAPGWIRLEGPHTGCKTAWTAAKRLHIQPSFNSPDLASGKPICGNWRP